MKRGAMIWLLVAGMALLTGCWDQVEMDELAVVNAMAVDRSEDGRWTVTYQVVIPRVFGMRTGGGGNGAPVMVFTTKGDTLGEAVGSARRELSRDLFFPHSQVVVIGRRAAERGIGDIVDFYLRDEESRETSNVLLYDGDTRGVLEVLTNVERLPGNAIHQMIEGAGRSSSVVPSKMHELVTSLLGPSMSAAVPEITVSGDLEKQNGSQAIQKTRRAAVLKMKRAGVLKKDKFVGWLTGREVIGLAFATDRVSRSEISFPCDDKGNKLATFLIERSDTDARPGAADGRLSVHLAIDTVGALMETSCGADLNRPDRLARLEEEIERRIEDDVRRSFDAAKKLKADVFDFASAFRRKYPRLWKERSAEWEGSFTEIRLEVEAEVKIRNTGLLNDPFTRAMEDRSSGGGGNGTD